MKRALTLLQLHADHRRWQHEIEMWKFDLKAWTAEHEIALEELAEVVELIHQHHEATTAHERRIAQFSRAIDARKKEIVALCKADANQDIHEPYGSHGEPLRSLETLRNAHERIKKHHHRAMAHVLALKAAFESAM